MKRNSRYKILTIWLICILVFKISFLKAQSGDENNVIAKINITGKVKNNSNEIMPFAVVMLLNEKDSTLLNYTTTNNEGIFLFKNVLNNNYILKITHIGFIPFQKKIKKSTTKDLVTEDLILNPISKLLMEVVVKEARAPLFIKGDTIEYNTEYFKVPPGATIEDLLKKLPGIEVDASGNVSTMGKDINKIYVDGKVFFSNNTKMVTKNLDAEAVSKIQVYDEKSEQEKLTGIANKTEQEKAMNLTLKEEYKKGYFGKAGVDAGPNDLYSGMASYNRYNESKQFSVIAYGNNLNSRSISYSDYEDFIGQSTLGNDIEDFGFGGYYSYRPNGLMLNSYRENGFSENYAGGLNYNYYKKKITLNTNYTINKSNWNYEKYSRRETFLSDSSFYNFDSINYNEKNFYHAFSSILNINSDSSNNIFIAKFNGSINNINNTNFNNQIFQTSDFSNINSNILKEKDNADKYSLVTSVYYSHRFKNKDRSFAVNSKYILDKNLSDNNIENINNYFMALTTAKKVLLLNDNLLDDKEIKTSIMYNEPIFKKIKLISFYNFNRTQNISGIIANNNETNTLIDSLSTYFINNKLYNRVGTSLNYINKGMRITLGGAFKNIRLLATNSNYKQSSSIISEIKKEYNNIIPYFNSNIDISKNISCSFTYSFDITEPSVLNLQPIQNLSNPLYRVEGNIDLSPEKKHEISAHLSYWNKVKFSNFSIGFWYSIIDESIVYNQLLKFEENTGYITISKPENVKGGNYLGSNFWTNFQIVKSILSSSLRASFNVGNLPIYINSVKNNTKNTEYSGSIRLNLKISSKLTYSLSNSIDKSYINYSINKNNNQEILNYTLNSGIVWNIAKKVYFESNFMLTDYSSTNKTLDQTHNILNASIKKIVGKKNKFEIRFNATDILNQSKYINQYARENYIEYIVSPTIARYFIFGISYNLKGFDVEE